MGLASLRRWVNLVGTKVPAALEIRAVLPKHMWSHRGRSMRLYREENLYNACVRTGDVTQELAPVEPAEESWTRMEVDDGQHDEQVECEDQPEELRRVLEARQPTELEAETFSNESCCVRTLVRGVCKSKRNRSTT